MFIVSKCRHVSNHRCVLCYPPPQVVFLPGFGCLYIDVGYERGTLVLSLAPEGSVDAVISQHSRYVLFYAPCIRNHLDLEPSSTACSLHVALWLLLAVMLSCRRGATASFSPQEGNKSLVLSGVRLVQ